MPDDPRHKTHGMQREREPASPAGVPCSPAVALSVARFWRRLARRTDRNDQQRAEDAARAQQWEEYADGR